jgi:hypothetical protein
MYGKYDFREINRDNFKTESNGTFTSYGGAIDAGLQHVFLSGVTVGLGVGAMFLKSSTVEFFKNVPTTTTFDGLKSRVLLTMGYSF